MSNISLIRIDQYDENEVCVPKGETSLGRGSTLIRCDDKRISRKHGLLQVSEDGVITLVSLHSNPCFYKTRDVDAYTVLLKGQSKILHDGDEFSLLPNMFKYRVVVKPEETDVSSVFQQNEAPVCVPRSTDIFQDNDHVTAENEETTSHGDQTHEQNTILSSSSSPYTTPPKKKRVLPGWLTNLSKNETTTSIITPSTSTTTINEKRKLPIDEVVNKKAKTNDAKEELPVVSIKLETDLPDTSAVPGTNTPPSTSRALNGGAQLHQMSSDEDEVKPDASPKKDDSPKKEDCPVKDGYEAEYGAASSATTRTPTDANQNAANAQSRECCVFGASCYRKNPQHRADFSHPGDADYSTNQDLPECPYGTSCYRKNLQHRKDFQHTRPPTLPPPPQGGGDPSQTRTKRRTATKTVNDSEDEDDYDYDDPFINDDNSDDYEPTSSEDSDDDNEDENDEESQERRRLLKEAKQFTKKKRLKNK